MLHDFFFFRRKSQRLLRIVHEMNLNADVEAGEGWANGTFRMDAKGQLMSECLLGVINFPKSQPNFRQISAL